MASAVVGWRDCLTNHLAKLGRHRPMYQLEIKNVGRSPAPVKVFINGFRTIALFSTIRDAENAKAIVESLRTDSALEYVKVV